MSDMMLTTVDNNVDPFTNFIEWFKYDTVFLHHNTCQRLSDIAGTSVTVSDEINEERIRDAMHYLVEENPTLYRIIYKNKDKEEELKEGEGVK